MLCVERLGLLFRWLGIDEFVPPNVAVVLPCHLAAGPSDYKHARDVRLTLPQGFFDGGLECARAAAPVPAICGNHQLGVCVDDPVVDGLRREPTEDH
jgi:hypothetical protein